MKSRDMYGCHVHGLLGGGWGGWVGGVGGGEGPWWGNS